jgi:hypothetical protein
MASDDDATGGILALVELWRQFAVLCLALYACYGTSHALSSRNALLKDYWLKIWCVAYASVWNVVAARTHEWLTIVLLVTLILGLLCCCGVP